VNSIFLTRDLSKKENRQDNAQPEATGCAESWNTKTVVGGRRARAAASAAIPLCSKYVDFNCYCLMFGNGNHAVQEISSSFSFIS
jgi:hypothetical protein